MRTPLLLKLLCLALLALLCSSALPPFGSHELQAADKPPYHLVVLGDPHIPGKFQSEKERVIDTINSWKDAELVVSVGDITGELGTDGEYVAAQKFFSRLTKPFIPMPGNHDYIYADTKTFDGRKKRGAAYERTKKLDLFRKTFGIPGLYHTKRVGEYLLVFLATDELHESLLAQMSSKQFTWLEQTLQENKTTATIIFFHAPLKGTLRNYNKNANSKNFVAQPRERIESLLKHNPQVRLWVSGHTHTSPMEESFASDLNRVGQLTTIHNTDMNRKNIWTNSLFLYNDRVVVKTYDHAASAWLPQFERSIKRAP